MTQGWGLAAISVYQLHTQATIEIFFGLQDNSWSRNNYYPNNLKNHKESHLPWYHMVDDTWFYHGFLTRAIFPFFLIQFCQEWACAQSKYPFQGCFRPPGPGQLGVAEAPWQKARLQWWFAALPLPLAWNVDWRDATWRTWTRKPPACSAPAILPLFYLWVVCLFGSSVQFSRDMASKFSQDFHIGSACL